MCSQTPHIGPGRVILFNINMQMLSHLVMSKITSVRETKNFNHPMESIYLTVFMKLVS